MINFIHVFFALIVGLKSIGMHSSNNIYIGIFALGCILVIAKYLKGNYSKNEIILFFVLFIVGFLDLIIGKSPTLLFTTIALSSLKNEDTKKILKILLFVKIISFIMMILLPSIGLMENHVKIFYRNGMFIKRYSFGYAHANELHVAYATTVFLFMYLYYDKLNLFKIIFLIICNYILYLFSMSRTGLITTCLCILLFYICKKTTRIKKIILCFCKHSYILFFLITILVSLVYDKIPYLNFLDELLSGRLQYNNFLLTNYSFPIIGNENFSQIANIDNGYISLAYNCGLIAFIIFSYIYIQLLKKLFDENRTADLLLVFSFLLYSFTESFLPSISVNLSLLLFSEIIYKKRRIKNEKIDNIYSDI